MSPARLRRICRRAAAQDPDLVLITGDLLTMESHLAVDAVVHALEPLAVMPGRIFACLGNHDYEARATVNTAIERIGGTLLVDAETVIDTRKGKIHIIGADFVWTDRKDHLQDLFTRIEPRRNMPTILLLHDPVAFKHLPDGAADLTLSGPLARRPGRPFVTGPGLGPW